MYKSLTRKCPVNEKLPTSKGIVSYSDWCKEEAKRSDSIYREENGKCWVEFECHEHEEIEEETHVICAVCLKEIPKLKHNTWVCMTKCYPPEGTISEIECKCCGTPRSYEEFTDPRPDMDNRPEVNGRKTGKFRGRSMDKTCKKCRCAQKRQKKDISRSDGGFFL